MNRLATHQNLNEPLYARRAELLPPSGTIAAHVMADLARRVRELAIFIIRNKGRSPFMDQQVEDGRRFFRYLAFHYLAGNVLIVRQGAKVAGVAIAWPERVRDIEERARLGEAQFDWRPAVSGGDAVMLAEVVGSRGHGFGWRKLALERWPDLHERRIFTHRRGKLVELHYATIKRFCRGRRLPVAFLTGGTD